MVSVSDAFEVRYKKGGENFEVLVDFDKLKEFKDKPNEINVYDVLADVKIFKDQKKGDIAPANEISKIFNNSSEEDVLKEILLKGECQIPTAFLNKLREDKKVQVINYISENAINPGTKTKYTNSMIEGEVNRLNFNFKPEIDYIRQATEVLDLLKKKMPIRISKVILKIKVEGQYCGAFYGPFRKYGKVTKESFDNDGNMHVHIEVNESIIDDVINYVKNHSKNTAEYVVSED